VVSRRIRVRAAEPALAARRTLQDRNETVVIRFLINTMPQSGVSERVISPQFTARANSILSVPAPGRPTLIQWWAFVVNL
jgi:hypothetical protein